MEVVLIPCAPAANESELRAFETFRQRLESRPAQGKWVLLANLLFAVDQQRQPDEIDLLCIGPPGVSVIEIKHWTAAWVEANSAIVEHEANRLIAKTRKVATTVRRKFPQLPRVDAVFLLTEDLSKVKKLRGAQVRGVTFWHLSDWEEALSFRGRAALTRDEVERLARALEPRAKVALDGDIRKFAGYTNLELQTPKSERFHRIYKAQHPRRQDRVILHLYDLAACQDKRAEEWARREFEALLRLQQFSWAPRVLDSFQPAPGYEGEMFFFTVLDPSAPTLEERASDHQWDTEARIDFARAAFRAFRELHSESSGLLHRCLTPQTILVRHNNTPIFTCFHLARVPLEESIASGMELPSACAETAAPEVKKNGLAAATAASDVFSLCASLAVAFRGREGALASRALEVLGGGQADDPGMRGLPEEFENQLAALLGKAPPPKVPAARFWSEDQIVRFRERDYRIVCRLGSGGVGATFKVVEIDGSEELGTYVGKVAHSAETAEEALHAYRIVRPHLGGHKGLSAIFEVASEWRENEFVALLKWIEGTPLGEYLGVFPLVAEQQGETAEGLAIRWIRQAAEALSVLHRAGLLHGDVSPNNLIVADSDIVLTDYDFVGRIGEPRRHPGTLLYSAPSCNLPALPSDDFYALAAAFFHVVFEREPFSYQDGIHKERGLNWEGLPRDEYPVLAGFLDKATHPDRAKRIGSLQEAQTLLEERCGARLGDQAVEEPRAAEAAAVFPEPVTLRPQRVEWLRFLLQSYPGSRWGNRETRGLDSQFAAETYVETPLEQTLRRDVEEGPSRLIVLCGNAGDGKTALLQHLAARVGLGQRPSSERIFQAQLPNGRVVSVNLDGSAAWQGRSSDELLDEFLAPFQAGLPEDDRVHLLAVNDGRLLEWIEHSEDRQGPTPLTEALRARLQGDPAQNFAALRLIHLNSRSLVGNLALNDGRIDTSFLERLVDRLYGGERAGEIWAPCGECSAKFTCEVFRATRLFGPDGVPEGAGTDARAWARRRLFDALQAVHVRGKTHITMRELRAALVYIFFGIHFCDDYHSGSSDAATPYWNRAFAAEAPGRQGEVLQELVRFDPALEANPHIDRHLSFDSSNEGRLLESLRDLASARRRAYFEWTPDEFHRIGEGPEALGLANGRHLKLFISFPLEKDEKKKQDLRDRICRGVSQLEDLPLLALRRTGVVPLRVTPRTPTETIFWVEKPLDAFALEGSLQEEPGLDKFHRELFLVYRYRDGREERLRLGADLFHRLLELSEGYQLGDVSSDDTFAQLSIFVRRLRREDESCLYAWNPMEEAQIYKLGMQMERGSGAVRQLLVLEPVSGGGS